ncbi:MAG: sugar ABC transporter permease [Chloroflexi bacterium]|nr:sugar ABC transporter permease [Chloroflexota bacterium]
MSVETVRPSRFRLLSDNERLLGAMMLAPAVLFILALVGLPLLISIAFSLSDVTVGDTSLDYVGLENFRRVIRTPQFQRAVINTFIFTTAALLIILVLANILAVLFTQDFRGKWLARILVILPWATPTSLGTLGWLWLLDSKFSPIDYVLVQIGLLGPDTLLGPGLHLNYLGREYLAMGSVVLVHVWRLVPLSAVILLAGLTSIDQELIDQAQVDGASGLRTHLQIKLPLITPIMAIASLFAFILIFTDLVVVFVLTRGGPIYFTQVLSMWSYNKGIEGGALAEGAAIALFFAPVLLVAAILILRTVRRIEVT